MGKCKSTRQNGKQQLQKESCEESVLHGRKGQRIPKVEAEFFDKQILVTKQEIRIHVHKVLSCLPEQGCTMQLAKVDVLCKHQNMATLSHKSYIHEAVCASIPYVCLPHGSTRRHATGHPRTDSDLIHGKYIMQ